MTGAGGITAGDVAGFLGQGLLGEVVALFRAEPELYALLGELVLDENIAVRLGASALVEELAGADPGGRGWATAALLPLLGDASAVARGDAAYLVGVVGGPETATALLALAEGDPNADVREIALEAAERVRAG